jgi:collagenase-like PrtC family protease
VWLTGDPQIAREAEQRANNPSTVGRIALTLHISGSLGQSLSVRAEAQFGARQLLAAAASASPLTAARAGGIHADLLRDKLAALGGSPFHLAELDCTSLPSGLHLPVSELKQLRRDVVQELTAQLVRSPWLTSGDLCLPKLRTALTHEPTTRGAVRSLTAASSSRPARLSAAVAPRPTSSVDRPLELSSLRSALLSAAAGGVLDKPVEQPGSCGTPLSAAAGQPTDVDRPLELSSSLAAADAPPSNGSVSTPAAQGGAGSQSWTADAQPRIVPLCRTPEQLAAVIAAGVTPGDEIELDFMEFVGLGSAVRSAREAGLSVSIATLRVQKPGEESLDRRIAALSPDAVLVRHWGALMHFAERRDPSAARLHGDFSLNVTNSITARHVLGLGLDTVTASHDLDREQLLALLEAAPRGRVAVTVHHHIPTFHNSHCVYAHLLSDGADYRSCGRPCESHKVALRDFAGHDHPVIVDVACRNTMFNAQAQSAAPLVPELLARGVQRFRLEFVWETAQEVTQTLSAYRALLRGELTTQAALRKVGVHEQYGVTLLRGAKQPRAAERI